PGPDGRNVEETALYNFGFGGFVGGGAFEPAQPDGGQVEAGHQRTVPALDRFGGLNPRGDGQGGRGAHFQGRLAPGKRATSHEQSSLDFPIASGRERPPRERSIPPDAQNPPAQARDAPVRAGD